VSPNDARSRIGQRWPVTAVPGLQKERRMVGGRAQLDLVERAIVERETDDLGGEGTGACQVTSSLP
jgi:hypothetical protein